jgi:hypothetical protein
MSFFGTFRKKILIKIGENTHTFYALRGLEVSDFLDCQEKLNSTDKKTVIKGLKSTCQLISDLYVGEDKPKSDDLLELDLMTIRSISSELVTASTPLSIS